ncbi:MAG: hypothetical protein HY823_01265 [Acidobacteria bacterium]|nr:hypothetical protein [Acidobacteriota bacterium]
MSSDRIIPSDRARDKAVEAFPYFPVDLSMALESEGPGEDDQPIGSALSTPEEDAQRLASVDHLIHTRLQEAEHRALDIARQAYEEGFAAGEGEGRAFGESQYRTYIHRLEEHLAQLASIRDAFQRSLEEEAAALALAVGEYLAAQQIRSPRSDVKELLDRVLDLHPLTVGPGLQGGAALTVRINPRDLEMLGERLPIRDGLHFLPDPELGRGSLRVETTRGLLEATVEQRRERLLELLQRVAEEG